MKKAIAGILFAVLLLCAAGCGAKTDAQTTELVDLGSVMQEMLDAVSLPEMMTLNGENLTEYFGLEPQWYADCAACVNANGYEKDEIILVRAADADSVPQIRECLETSLENAAAEMQNYIPEQYAMIRACKVESRGLYVWLFISDAAEELQSVWDGHF